ncbi:hypothetical protein LJK88_39125 [Paenibacillus sp. P26]|nr:hypothetical protein LJK88_39125 [Paenibacillus sp. P26]
MAERNAASGASYADDRRHRRALPVGGSLADFPSWRNMILFLPLQELSYEEFRLYMEKHGVTDEAESDRLWLQTLGHPLALSLLVPSGLGIANQGQIPGRGAAWEELLALWLREARDHELRDLLQAASVPRSFNQEFLSLLAGREVPLSYSNAWSASPLFAVPGRAGGCMS